MASGCSITDCIRQFNPDIQPKAKQLECIQYIMEGRDVIANLPVGFGKSMIYQCLPLVFQNVVGKTKTIVLVISPLNIIQNEQTVVLQNRNISTCRLAFCDNDGTNELDKTVNIKDIAEGRFQVVFCHPEAILNTQGGRELLSNNRFIEKVAAVVVDECHVVESWGEEFRTSFKKLKTLPAVFLKATFVALSGTITSADLKKLPEILGLHQPAIVQETPDRINIFLEKHGKINSNDVVDIYEDIFKSECDLLKENPQEFPVTLLFMPLFYLSQAAAYLSHLFEHVNIHTSCYSVLFSKQDKAVIQATVKELQKNNPRIRLILTSSVAGMGFDPPSVVRVIHAKPPRNLSQYLQEIGRAGRRGQKSKAVLYYSPRDLAKNLPGLQNDIIAYCTTDNKCLRQMLLQPFGFIKSDLPADQCCSFCNSQ